MASVNGKEYSWVSVTIYIGDAAEMVEITAVKYPWKVDAAKVMGGGRKAYGMTRGRLVPESGSLTLFESGYRRLAATPGWCDRTTEIVVTYAEPGMATQVDTVKGVRFTGADGGAEEGADGLKREVSFEFTDVLINGVSPIDEG
jgi:hypothetical protein